jgi:hypothetical protein
MTMVVIVNYDAKHYFTEALFLVKFQSEWKNKSENDLVAF